MKLIWSPDALAHLEAIMNRIGEDSPAAVRKWLRQVKEVGKRIRTFPRAGRISPDYDDDMVREVLHGSYRIIYVIGPHQIEVLSVWHGARRPPGGGMAADFGDEE